MTDTGGSDLPIFGMGGIPNMGTRRVKAKTTGRVNLHLVVDADDAARFRAFAGHYGRTYGDVFAEAVKLVARGFSVHVHVQRPVIPEGQGSDAA